MLSLLSCRESVQDKAAQHSKEHDAVVLKMAENIKSKVEEMMASEAIQERIQRRLKEERAALEDKVLLTLNSCLCLIPRADCTGGEQGASPEAHFGAFLFAALDRVMLLQTTHGQNEASQCITCLTMHYIFQELASAWQTIEQLLIPSSCSADDEATRR